jgi:hypothetical protein
MKKIYLLLSILAMLFSACETDFDVNAEWEETTIVYGLLDVSKEIQYIRINKAYLGDDDAMIIAQNSDSINFHPVEMEVKLYKLEAFGNLTVDTITHVLLVADTLEKEDGLFATDNNIIYKTGSAAADGSPFIFSNNNRYALIIKNKATGNKVSANSSVISGFDFDNIYQNTLSSERPSYPFGFYTNGDFKSSTITWEDANDNGKIYQLDLIINYTEESGANSLSKSLTYSLPLVDDTEDKIRIEGEGFFNFLKLNLTKDENIIRHFNGIDMLMTVGSENLETYINVNKPITGIVQERPQFTNINNGIGLFSSRFTKLIENYDLSDNSLEYLKSVDGLDRNFQ